LNLKQWIEKSPRWEDEYRVFAAFTTFIVARGWDREGQQGTRGDSLDAVVVHVMLPNAAGA
jgi:hypothetical protein